MSNVKMTAAAGLPRRKSLCRVLLTCGLLLTWALQASAGVTTTGSIYDVPSNYRVGDTADGTLRIDAGNTLSRYTSYVGNLYGCTGTATVSGDGSSFILNDTFHVGQSGRGILRIEAGGQVSNAFGCIGYNPTGTGTATVTGAGSKWLNSGALYVGDLGQGQLLIENGGFVSNTFSYVGFYSDWINTATVRGAGSTWTNSGDLHVKSGRLYIQAGATLEDQLGAVGIGDKAAQAEVTGTGSTWTNHSAVAVGKPGTASSATSLTVADGAKVTAVGLLNQASDSSVVLHVSGSDMIVLGTASSPGYVRNYGKIFFYSNAFDTLPAATYKPISESAGRNIGWENYGSHVAFGGTWNDANKTFTAGTLNSVAAGSGHTVVSGERLLITDPGSGQSMSASFTSGASGTTFSAVPATDEELLALAATSGFRGEALSAWDLSSSFSSGQILLSFDIGAGKVPSIWRLHDGTWAPYDAGFTSYESGGMFSFTVSDAGGYAVVPEPATLGLLSLAAVAMLRRRRK